MSTTAGPRLTIREQKQRDSATRQAHGRARRERQKAVTDLEVAIQRLEQRQKELTTELEDAATYEKHGRAVAVNRELSGLTEDLARAVAEWEQAAARLNELAPVS